MAKGMYLEHYLDSIEGLPCELQRNFSLMEDLDNRTEEKKAEISELASEYIAKVRNLASEERVQHLKKIENAYNKCKEYSDDKVQLAMQIYEMVDEHIRRLDADLARFENDLQEKLDSASLESSDEKQSRKDKNIKEKRASHGTDKKGSDQDSPKQKKTEKWKEGVTFILAVVMLLPPPSCQGDAVQVSYGEMIGCDNSDIHFCHCCGLTTTHDLKNIIFFRSQLSTVVLKISAQ
uniref:Inhibitor of growth family, member 5b n=1 Tax=Sinocyclocheilus anshuiensis TaxID=1608454 RepID=A0A671KFX0_9TELE